MTHALDGRNALTAEPEPAGPRSAGGARSLTQRFLARNLLWIALAIIVVGLSIASESFRNPANLQNILMQNGIIGIVAMGMLVMMIGGGFDLSVGAAGGAVGVLTAYLSGHVSLPIAIVAGILLGMAIGTVNGVVVARLGINSFIATFAVASIITGILFVLTSSRSIPGKAAALTDFAFSAGAGIPMLFVVFLAFALITWLLLSKSKWGHWLYSVGANAEASYLSGIPVLRVRIAAFVFGGLAVGVAGVFLFGQSSIGQPTAAADWPLNAIAICVIAGTSLSGGVGRVSNVIAAVLLLGVVSNGLNQLGISPYWQPAVTGTIILAAVISEQLTRSRGRA